MVKTMVDVIEEGMLMVHYDQVFLKLTKTNYVVELQSSFIGFHYFVLGTKWNLLKMLTCTI